MKAHSQTTSELEPQKLLFWIVAIFVAFGWIFWDFLQRQFWFAVQQQADWGHTLVIPFISGYFIWLYRAKILQEPFKRAWTGLVFLFIGLGWYMICALGPTAWHHHNLMGLGVASTTFGICLFLFGWRSMVYLWFPLFYLFVFGQTISDRFMEIVTFKLQDIASVGSYYGLSFLGLDVTRAGNTIEILYNDVSHPLNIAEACSGMRMLMAFLALGVAMAFTGLKYAWQRITLVILALPTAVFVNILRVITLGLLSIADSGFAAGDFHTFVGTLWLIPAFLIYLGIVWILKNLIIEEEDSFADEEPERLSFRFSGSATVGFVVAILSLSLTAGGLQAGVRVLNVHLQKEAVFPRENLSLLPQTIGKWTKLGEDIRFDAAGVEALGTDLYLSRAYGNLRQSRQPMQLHVAYYTGQVDAVPHVPDRCMVAGGFVPLTAEPIIMPMNVDTSFWNLDTKTHPDGTNYPYIEQQDGEISEPQKIRLPIGDFELRVTEFSHPKLGNDHMFAGYFFIANGKTTAYPERIRLLAFDRSSKKAYYCKVQFTMQGGGQFDIEQFTDIATDFTNNLLPEIMKCLPDWAEETEIINNNTLTDN
jgi:exosortase